MAKAKKPSMNIPPQAPQNPLMDPNTPKVIFGYDRLRLIMTEAEANRAMRTFGCKTPDELTDYIPTMLVGMLLFLQGIKTDRFFEFIAQNPSPGLEPLMRQCNQFMGTEIKAHLLQDEIEQLMASMPSPYTAQ